MIIWERIPGKDKTRNQQLTKVLEVSFDEIKIHGLSSLEKIAVLLCTAKHKKYTQFSHSRCSVTRKLSYWVGK